MKHKFIKY